MGNWLSGVRGSIAMILTWTLGWGLGFGGIMELVDPNGQIVDIWPTAMAIPGFVGGVLFSVLLRVAEAGRRFDEISVARFLTWGVVTGVVLGLLTIPAEVGDVSPGAAGMTGILTGLGAVAALASALVFRLIGRRQTAAITGS